jgi:hypothetical protein
MHDVVRADEAAERIPRRKRVRRIAGGAEGEVPLSLFP